VGTVSVTLLGGFSAAVDGVAVDPRAWRLRKARELVKLLALAPGHRLHREQVMDVLWRDRPPAAAANNLHQAVHVARRALGADAIDVREGMLTLTAEIDVDQLEREAADARRRSTPAAYRSALSLYRGELLPENRYDDWVEDRREELADLAATLEDALDRIAADGDHQTPSLPSDTSSFVGRERELADLGALLATTRLLTLVGTGGVGKTTLALELARGAEAGYTGGAALVELGVLTDPALVPEAVAAALDVHALSGQSPLSAVIEYLAAQPLLLVFDNCEHLLAGAAGVAAELLRGAPYLTILATSREPLAVPGEVVFRVPSLDIPAPDQGLTPEQLLGYEAVRLFTDRAQAAVRGFELDGDNALDVARICFRLDGLPLALELAAGRLGALGPAAIAERLDDRFRLLRSGGHASPTRQHTLAATLDWSHDLLDAEERTLFRRLAVFAGSFDLHAVETVCPDGALPAEEIPDLLARLVEKSLVAIDDASPRERRYRLLETVRLYAVQRLDDAHETQQLRDAHAEWALALAEDEQGSPRLDRDAANLRMALDTLLERRPGDALCMCTALLPFWMRRIDLLEAQRRFDRILGAATEPSIPRARALIDAASIDLRSGAIARGHAHADESYAIATEIGDARSQWRALQFRGELSLAHDDVEASIKAFEQGLELARREGFLTAEATGVYSLGIARWALGDLTRAEELLADAADRFRALSGSPERIPSPLNFAETSQANGWPGLRVVFEDTLQPFVEMSCEAAVGYVLANQAGIVRNQGDLPRARVLLDESAARFADSGDERGAAAVLARRAYLELADGAPAAARAALEQALELRRQQRDRRGLGLALTGLGHIDTLVGEYASADENLAEARRIFRRAGDRWGLASALWRTADLALVRGQLDDAERVLQEARAVLGPTQRERWIASTLAGLAEVAVQRGDLDHATALLEDARRRYAARHDAVGVADIEQRLAGVANDVLRPVKDPTRTTPLTS
jgi:predicted ATPase